LLEHGTTHPIEGASSIRGSLLSRHGFRQWGRVKNFPVPQELPDATRDPLSLRESSRSSGTRYSPNAERRGSEKINTGHSFPERNGERGHNGEGSPSPRELKTLDQNRTTRTGGSPDSSFCQTTGKGTPKIHKSRDWSSRSTISRNRARGRPKEEGHLRKGGGERQGGSNHPATDCLKVGHVNDNITLMLDPKERSRGGTWSRGEGVT